MALMETLFSIITHDQFQLIFSTSLFTPTQSKCYHLSYRTIWSVCNRNFFALLFIVLMKLLQNFQKLNCFKKKMDSLADQAKWMKTTIFNSDDFIIRSIVTVVRFQTASDFKNGKLISGHSETHAYYLRSSIFSKK